LAGTDLRVSVVAVNTMLASAAGAVSAMVVSMVWLSKPDLSFMANGMLAGLVAVTAPCAYVNSTGAVVIGLVAGALLIASAVFVERRLKIDDPVGAISVHGVNGAWGVLSLGLFADGVYGDGLNGVPGTVRGLFYGGGFKQLGAEAVGVVVCFAFAFVAFYAFFKLVGLVVGNRVSAEVEMEGLDLAEVGVLAYPEFHLHTPVTQSAAARLSGGVEAVAPGQSLASADAS
jgi:Amt family ammonium transporter